MLHTITYHKIIQSLNEAHGFLAKDLDLVNGIILDKLSLKVPLINGMAGYLIQAGGKRLRPLLVLLCSRLLGYKGRRHIKLAACVEFIHTATLLHDDIVDRSTERRGRPSANSIWGDQASLLVGDFLFSRAFELITEDGSLDILKILSKTTVAMSEGEIMQLGSSGNLELSKSQYLQIIGAKTAALFEACCHMGGLISGGSEREIDLLKEYGYNFGLAFQIMDDWMDYGLNKSYLKKSDNNDFLSKNVTLPLIMVCERATSEEKGRIKDMFSCGVKNELDSIFLKKIMKKYEIEKNIMDQARLYASVALKCLSHFEPCQERDILKSFTSPSYI